MARSLGADDILAHAMINVGTARYERGGDAGREMLDEALHLAREIGASEDDAVRALTNLGWTAWTHRDLATAYAYLERGITFASERDLTAMELYQRAIRASVLLARGRFHDARAEAEGLASLPAAITATRVLALTCVGRAMTIMAEKAGHAALLNGQRLRWPGWGSSRAGAEQLAASAEAAWLGGDMSTVVRELEQVFRGGDRA